MAGVLLVDVPADASVVARGTLGGAVGAAHNLSPEVGNALLGAARAAFERGFVTVALIGLLLMLLAAALFTVLARERVRAPSCGNEGASEAARHRRRHDRQMSCGANVALVKGEN